MTIKQFILSHKILYESYFFFARKSINRKKLDKEIVDYLNSEIKEKSKIKNLIVSLTTYGERLLDLKYTLYSLVNQTIQPDKIVVWLSETEFSYETIPDNLIQFEKFGVVFEFCKDTRSYKKLCPALIKYADYNIVTADDDIFYKKDWLEKLWIAHQKNPDDIITHIAHKLKFDINKKLLNYNNWESAVNTSFTSGIFFPTGGGGTLYPPDSLLSDCTNEKLFKELTPLADDVWFFFMGLLNNKKIVIVKNPYNKLRYVDIYKEYGLNNKSTLQSQNVENNLNDDQIRNVMNYYNLTDEQLFYMNNGKF